jgi:hypothetical protein
LKQLLFLSCQQDTTSTASGQWLRILDPLFVVGCAPKIVSAVLTQSFGAISS